MKILSLSVLLTMFLCMFGTKASAHDIEVKNADGKTIYYNYINGDTELKVTCRGSSSYDYENEYQRNVIITEEVIYMNRKHKVTSTGNIAFYGCTGLTSVTIPNSMTSIGWRAFSGCSGLKKVIVKDIAAWCEIKFVDGYSNPLTYAYCLYSDEDTEIKNIVIPNTSDGASEVDCSRFYFV